MVNKVLSWIFLYSAFGVMKFKQTETAFSSDFFLFFCFNLSWLGHCTRRSWFFHSVYVALEMMIEVGKAAGFSLCRSGLVIKLTAFSSDFHDERGMEMLQVGPSKIAVATFTLKWLSLYSDMVNCHQVCTPSLGGHRGNLPIWNQVFWCFNSTSRLGQRCTCDAAST